MKNSNGRKSTGNKCNNIDFLTMALLVVTFIFLVFCMSRDVWWHISCTCVSTVICVSVHCYISWSSNGDRRLRRRLVAVTLRDPFQDFREHSLAVTLHPHHLTWPGRVSRVMSTTKPWGRSWTCYRWSATRWRWGTDDSRKSNRRMPKS